MSLKMKALAVLLGVAMAVSPTVGGGSAGICRRVGRDTCRRCQIS